MRSGNQGSRPQRDRHHRAAWGHPGGDRIDRPRGIGRALAETGPRVAGPNHPRSQPSRRMSPAAHGPSSSTPAVRHPSRRTEDRHVDVLQPVTSKLEILGRGVALFDQEVVVLAAPSRPLERGDDVASLEPHR